MTTFTTGRQAEAAAAEYLKSQGFEIVSQNWRTQACEIDIVAKKRKTIYFVEVKYRRGSAQGSGLEYITPAKQRQMQFVAEVWVNENDWVGDYQLAGLEVSGDQFEITDFIESI